ncbi:RAMP superfamily CRISPR-associated protein [Acetivibrio cellulolyticus]|uniref:RAMP superfamily CRISPR-associated protein n=1 Tax=Acetivibrio cellulolyticus TaxID=35830 RepID=UPI0001E2FC0D|nr:RAMP superfamily CRISPR-associated protein [Acetivibrio cellulolyticus]
MTNPISKIYKVRFKLRSPLHISSGNNGDGITKSAKVGIEPFIPASTIKGKIRSNFKSLLPDKCCNNEQSGTSWCECPVCSIFGKAGYQPSRIYIQNLKYNGEKDLDTFGIRSTVAIDRFRRVARDGSLAFTEVIDNGSFEGDLEVYYSGDSINYEKQLIAAIKMIESIGKGKSRGWGFVDVEVTILE